MPTSFITNINTITLIFITKPNSVNRFQAAPSFSKNQSQIIRKSRGKSRGRNLNSVPMSPIYRRARPGVCGKSPVFLWFCPSICDFGHVHERCWAVWQTGQQRFQRALNHKKMTKSPKPEFCPSLRPSNARIFVQKAPVFRQSFHKNEPVWRIRNTVLYFTCK